MIDRFKIRIIFFTALLNFSIFCFCANAESPLSPPTPGTGFQEAGKPGSSGKPQELSSEVKELIASSPSPAQLPEDAAIFLLYEERDRVEQDGKAEMRYHKLIKILKESGKGLSQVSLPYNRVFEELEIKIARTVKPDGRTVPMDPALVQDAAAIAQYPIFDDLRIRQMVFPDVSVGDCLELEYVVRVKKPRIPGVWSTYFAHPLLMTQKCRLSIDLPSTIEGHFTSRLPEFVKPKITSAGGRVNYEWDVKPLTLGGGHEPALPPNTEMDSFIFFSTMRSWDTLTAWYVPLFESKLKEISPAVKAKAVELTQGTNGDREKIIKKLFNFVSQQVPYVEIALGDSGWIPYPPDYVLNNRYGDCKGKASLLIALLRSMGIDAYGVLIRPLNRGRILSEIPSDSFTHLIVAIPKAEGGYLFMDPTIPMAPYDFLDPFEEKQDVIILDRKEAHFEKTPSLPLEKSNYRYSTNTSKIGADGSIIEDSQSNAVGLSGIQGRMLVRSINPSILKDFLVEGLRKKYPQSTLENYRFSDVENVDEPFLLVTKARIVGPVQFAGDLILVDQGGNVAEDLAPLVTFDKRTYPLFLGMREMRTSEGVITPPEGYMPKSVPSDLSIVKPFGSFERKIEVRGNQLVAKFKFIINQLMIPVETYPEFKKFIVDVFAAEKEKWIFEKSK